MLFCLYLNILVEIRNKMNEDLISKINFANINLIKENPDYIKKIPKNEMTKEVIVYIYCNISTYIKFIPKDLLNEGIYESIIHEDVDNMKLIEEKHLTEELCILSLNHNPYLMENVPKRLHTEKLINFVVTLNGTMIRYIDEEKWTDELLLKALKETPVTLSYIPHERQTIEMVESSVYRMDGRYVKSTNPKYITEKFIDNIYEHHGASCMYFIKPHLKEINCMRIVRRDPEMYLEFEEKFRTERILVVAFRNDKEEFKEFINQLTKEEKRIIKSIKSIKGYENLTSFKIIDKLEKIRKINKKNRELIKKNRENNSLNDENNIFF